MPAVRIAQGEYPDPILFYLRTLVPHQAEMISPNWFGIKWKM